jgi:hypothetical protein
VTEQPGTGGPGDEAIVVDGASAAAVRPWWHWALIALGALASLTLIYFLFIKEPEPEYKVDPEALEELLEEIEASPSPSPSVTPSPSDTPSPSVTPSPAPSASATPVPTPDPSPEPSPTPEPSPSPEPPEPGEPATEFGPGVYLVGDEVAPGTYRVEDVVTWNADAPCGWVVKHEGVTAPEDLIGNPAVIGGKPTITLVAGDMVGTRNCPTFVAVDASALFQNPDADVTATPGVWLVGEDILPGTYGSVPGVTTLETTGTCYFVVTESLENNFQTVIAYDATSPGAENIVLTAGQQFQSANCGDWALLTR